MSLDFLSELLDKRPVSFTVLVLFVLDRSHSMLATRTYDHRSKWEHLVDLTKMLIRRLEASSLAPTYRLGFIWFSDDTYIVSKDGKKYFTTYNNEARDAFESSIKDNKPIGKTAIADALEAAAEVIEEYIADPELPDEKYVTVFLFTDGRETKRTVEDVYNAADKITGELYEKIRQVNERNRIGLATIALGKDADREMLRNIASFLRDAQRKVLEERGLLELVDPPYHEKMFIDAPKDDKITREWEEAVRRFVERLSETAVY